MKVDKTFGPHLFVTKSKSLICIMFRLCLWCLIFNISKCALSQNQSPYATHICVHSLHSLKMYQWPHVDIGVVQYPELYPYQMSAYLTMYAHVQMLNFCTPNAAEGWMCVSNWYRIQNDKFPYVLNLTIFLQLYLSLCSDTVEKQELEVWCHNLGFFCPILTFHVQILLNHFTIYPVYNFDLKKKQKQ